MELCSSQERMIAIMKQYASSERTKKAIAESLKALMQTKDLNHITIREIIEGCGINRKTFYYHFRDIYDLVEWMFNREALDFLRQCNTLSTYEEAIRFTFRYIQENPHICSCAVDSLGTSYLKRFFYKDLHDIILDVVRDTASGMKVPEDYLLFITDFYLHALISVLLDWVRRGMDSQDSERVLHYIELTVQGNVRASLLRAAEEAVLQRI